MTVVGTKLPILDVCSTAAVGGNADVMLLVLSLSDVDLAATSKVMTGRSFAWGRLAGPTLPPLSHPRRGWRPALCLWHLVS